MSSTTPPSDPSGPERPRAPTQAAWDAMTTAERQRALDALPAYVPNEEGPLEGDRHQRASAKVVGALRAWFESTGRKAYVSGQMAMYFPGEPRVMPDVFVVPGAEDGLRDSWVVSAEGRAPAWVLEIAVRGHRDKDLRDHVTRYAQLGIREYFVVDIPKRRVWGYRLHDPAIAIYAPIVPQLGRYHSDELGLDLRLEGELVHLYHGNARLLDHDEMAELLRDQLNDEQVQRHEAEARAAAELTARHEAEARAAAAEVELARLRALLAERTGE